MAAWLKKTREGRRDEKSEGMKKQAADLRQPDGKNGFYWGLPIGVAKRVGFTFSFWF